MAVAVPSQDWKDGAGVARSAEGTRERGYFDCELVVAQLFFELVQLGLLAAVFELQLRFQMLDFPFLLLGLIFVAELERFLFLLILRNKRFYVVLHTRLKKFLVLDLDFIDFLSELRALIEGLACGDSLLLQLADFLCELQLLLLEFSHAQLGLKRSLLQLLLVLVVQLLQVTDLLLELLHCLCLLLLVRAAPALR